MSYKPSRREIANLVLSSGATPLRSLRTILPPDLSPSDAAAVGAALASPRKAKGRRGVSGGSGNGSSKAHKVKLFPPHLGGADQWAPAVLLSLDPASRFVGWSVFHHASLHEFGLIRRPAAWAPTRRLGGLTDDVAALCDVQQPTAVVMEFSDGKVARRMKGHAAGLSIMGAAQGAIWQMLRARGLEVETVGENEWSGSRPKKARAADVRFGEPRYGEVAAAGKDEGMDISDSLGLAWWWLCRRRTEWLEAGINRKNSE